MGHMLDQIIRSDPVLKKIILRGGITMKQLDYLLTQKLSESNSKLLEKIMKTNNKPPSKASYIITRERGKSNIKQAMYTLIIAHYLGLVRADCFAGLEKTGFVLKESKDKELSVEQTTMVLLALEALIDRLILV